jgi:hypothetical protein
MSYTKDLINTRGTKDVAIIDLVNKLNAITNYNNLKPQDSIMTHGNICGCDDSFLCEHRLQWIIDWAIKVKK